MTLIGAGVVVVDDFDGGDRRVTGVVKLRCEQAEALRSLKRPVLVLWGHEIPIYRSATRRGRGRCSPALGSWC